MIVLSVFLAYCVPATGADPPVLLVGVNPAHNLRLPAVPVNDNDKPLNVVGAAGTNLPNMKFSSLIESFVWSVLLIVNAPDLNPPAGAVSYTHLRAHETN